MTPEALLRHSGISLPSFAPGRYYTHCPQCSRLRSSAEHRNAKVLGVTIKDNGSVKWGCNHCGWTGPQKDDGNGVGGHETTAYVYRARDGAVLFRKVRNAPLKKFWIERPDGNGGWIKGAKGVNTAILYRLDEVREAIADHRTVVIAEGEKDVDNLWRFGFAATCNAHGASEPGKVPKWMKIHSEQLRGADIIVLNDNDPSGYAHAETTCRLSLGVAKRVQRLDLALNWPDIPKGGDVSDWIARDHSRPELEALIASAPDYQAEPVAAPPESNGDKAEAEALAKLAAGDTSAFVKRAKADVGFPFEREALAKLAEVAKRKPADFERLRGRLKSVGVRVAALEAAMHACGAVGDGLPGRPIEFAEIEPWPDPVDGAAMLSEAAKTIGSYVIMSEHQRDACALWLLHAHAHDLRDASPPLVVRSPTLRSGKTKFLEVAERIVPRSLLMSGITVAFLERVIDDHRPTLLIDEFDALTSKDQALAEKARLQLNRSSKRSAASSGKTVPLSGGGHEPRMFSTWAPTIIAGIGDAAATIRDRAVVIDLKRKLSSETVKPLRTRDGGDLRVIARKFVRFVADNETRLREIKPEALAVDNDRAVDMWEPLLALADIAGGDWPQRARAAGVKLTEERETAAVDMDVRLMLLADIRDIFDAAFPPDHWQRGAPAEDEDARREGRPDDGPRLSTKELLERLCALEERPWNAWRKEEKPMTGKGLGDLLRAYGVRSGSIRLGGGGFAKGYYLRSFEDPFTRYLPKTPLQSVTPDTIPGKPEKTEIFQSDTKSVCVGLKNAGNPSKSGDCGGVTLQKPENAATGETEADSGDVSSGPGAVQEPRQTVAEGSDSVAGAPRKSVRTIL